MERTIIAIELETLFEKFYKSKCKGIEIFGSKLKAIKDELYKRALFDVSTEKLIELLVKHYGILKQ